jgi:hypothetical protein
MELSFVGVLKVALFDHALFPIRAAPEASSVHAPESCTVAKSSAVFERFFIT